MKICIATGTRAEYGLLENLIDQIKKEPGLILQLLVTGAHLSPEFGLTYKQIEEDGHQIDFKVEMLLSSDTPEGITKSMGLGVIGFADAFKVLDPDLLVILGDRYEMLAIASTALIFKIPIAHIHGGEITEGAYDDAIRHAITKMSHLHFTSTEEYRRRVIQLGEQPKYVFNVGAIGLDILRSLSLLSRKDLEEKLEISFQKYNYIIAFHPETLGKVSAEDQFKSLLAAIDEQEESFFIFTKSNADTNGRVINQLMESYASDNPDKAAVFASLGTLKFLSVMKIADAIVGNSSSGIIEAPSLLTATINVGERQRGRVQAKSIVNCDCIKMKIMEAFDLVKSPSYKSLLKDVDNPYSSGKTSEKILHILKEADLESLRRKAFHNFQNEYL